MIVADLENSKAHLYLVGVSYLAMAQVDRAIEVLQEVTRKDSEDLETVHTLAQAYLRMANSSFEKFQDTYSRIEGIDLESYRTPIRPLFTCNKCCA